MREILFRGKTERGYWAYGSLISAGKYCCILESEEKVHPMDYPYLDSDLGTIDGQATPVIPETVGQFTGLLDKNGKKIFEGDIVEYEAHGYIPYVKRGVVIFNNGYFGIEYDCSISRSDRPLMAIHQIGKTTEWQDMGASGTITYTYEIIGNIHDNPELLEVK